MKIRIDIDTTPAEVREFFGLPNLKQLQGGSLTRYLST